MKNKGFTLVELLAVIVVLAIIALIGYMTVGDVIEGTQESADKQTIREYAKGVEQAVYNYMLSTGNDITSENSVITEWINDNLEFSKSKVECNRVSYLDGVHLNGCSVNGRETTYCYKDNNVYECDSNVLTYLSRIYGNSVQDGTPTPETPIEVESLGDRTVNLFDPTLNFTTTTQYGISVEYLEDEDVYVLNGTATATALVASRYINLQITKGSYFSLSTEYVSGTLTRPNGTEYAVAYFGAADAVNTSNNWATVNLRENNETELKLRCNYDFITQFWFYVSAGVTFDNYKVRIQLQEDSTATEYEPYGYKIPITVSNGTTSETRNIYLDEPLRKIGDYADYVDFENKKVVRILKYREFSENDSWSLYQTFANHFQISVGDNYFAIGENYVISNYYPTTITRSGYYTNDDYGVISVDSNRIRFKNKDYTTLEEWKNWLSTLNEKLYVIYRLRTPIEESITIPELPILEGNVTYNIGTTIKPSSIDYGYRS